MPLQPFDAYQDLLPRTATGLPCLFTDAREPLPSLPMDLGMTWDSWAPWTSRWNDPDLLVAPGLTDLKTLARGQPQALYDHFTDHEAELTQDQLNDALDAAVKPRGTVPTSTGLMAQELSVALLIARGARCERGVLASAVVTGNPRLLHRLLGHLTPDAQEELVDPTPAAHTTSPLLSLASRVLRIDPQGPVPYIMARQLLDAGAPPDAQDQLQRRSVLHWAAANRRSGVVQALLEAGANDRVLSPRGHTVLHFAAAANDVVTMRLLIGHGADPHARTEWTVSERTPVELGFELQRLAGPTLADEISTWVAPSVIPAPRAQRVPRVPPGRPGAGAVPATHTPPPATPGATVVPPHREWHDTPMTQAAYFGASDAMALLMSLGVDPCPPLEPNGPPEARDERTIALLERAWRDARSDDDAARMDRASAGRVLVERRLLLGLDDPDVHPPSPDTSSTVGRRRL